MVQPAYAADGVESEPEPGETGTLAAVRKIARKVPDSVGDIVEGVLDNVLDFFLPF